MNVLLSKDASRGCIEPMGGLVAWLRESDAEKRSPATGRDASMATQAMAAGAWR